LPVDHDSAREHSQIREDAQVGSQTPDESRQVFEFCFGRTYRIKEVDGQGLFVLDVSADIDHRFGGFMNDIRLEAEFLEEVV
jgi:hypothetical protein